MVPVSVVVVSYNVAPLLRRCLACLDDADEVVVVDNASPDRSADLVQAEFPAIRLIGLSENVGFSAAVNIGARASTAPFLLLLNPDTELAQGTLAAMVRELEARPAAGAIGCRQVAEDGRFQLTVGPRPSLVLELIRMVIQGRLDHGDRWLAHRIDLILSRPRAVPWVAGSCLLVRRDAFKAIGGFDERFFLYFEDIDFCLRLGAAGYTVNYVPSVTVLHHRGRSAATDASFAANAYRESQLWYWEKHRGPRVSSLVAMYQRWRGVAPTGS